MFDPSASYPPFMTRHTTPIQPMTPLRLQVPLRLRLALLSGLLLLVASAILLLFLNLTFRWLLLGDMLTVKDSPTPTIISPTGAGTHPNNDIFLTGVTIVPEVAIMQLQQLSCIGFLVVAVVGGSMVYLTSKRALRPLTHMSKEAQQMGSTDLHQRLSVPPSHDELRLVATSFNQVLERLEQAFQRQGQFLDDVAHELRTPVAVMHAQLQSALESTTPQTMESAAPTLESCLQSLQRLEHIIESLLLMARTKEPFVPVPVALVPIVEDVVAELDMLATEKEVCVDMAIKGEPWILGNETLLMVMIANLVKNGILYNRPRGMVRVTIAKEADRAVVTVVDNGVGIPTQALPHIFDRFFRADSSRSRTTGASGLGLAIVADLVSKHQGTISATSHVNVGSTFTITLPAIPTPIPTSAIIG